MHRTVRESLSEEVTFVQTADRCEGRRPGGIPGGEKSKVTAVQLETHIGVFEKTPRNVTRLG